MATQEQKDLDLTRTDFYISQINRQLKEHGHVKPYLARNIDAHLEVIRARYLTARKTESPERDLLNRAADMLQDNEDGDYNNALAMEIYKFLDDHATL